MEYIKKSDVKTIISRIENINIAVDSWEQIEELPTINFSGIIDEMIAQEEHIEHNSFNERERTFGQYAKIRLQELRDILYIKSGDFQKDLDKITF